MTFDQVAAIFDKLKPPDAPVGWRWLSFDPEKAFSTGIISLALVRDCDDVYVRRMFSAEVMSRAYFPQPILEFEMQGMCKDALQFEVNLLEGSLKG